MTYPILVVCNPGEKSNAYVDKYSSDIRTNPQVLEESALSNILSGYADDDWNWLYDVNDQPAPLELVWALKDHVTPVPVSQRRQYRYGCVAGRTKPTLIDYAREMFDKAIVVTTRVPADQMPAQSDMYILTDDSGTELIDIVGYRVIDPIFVTHRKPYRRTNFLVTKSGKEFAAGAAGSIDWQTIDQTIIADLLPWALKDQQVNTTLEPRALIGGRVYQHRPRGLGISDEGNMFPLSARYSENIVNPASTMSIDDIKLDILNKEYGRLRVIKPDGQLLSCDGRIDKSMSAYIREYLQSLSATAFILVQWPTVD